MILNRIESKNTHNEGAIRESKSPYAKQFELKEKNVNKAINKMHKLPRPTEPMALIPEWCMCGNAAEFLCYPEDGECSCGVNKHHVHCKCGRISQVG
jgi:hypothetical protein